jgi:hypothetical protein
MPRTIYITKYALTTGIIEVLEDPSHTWNNRTLIVQSPHGHNIAYSESEWFFDRQEALAQARKMRDAKIKSLEKKLAKLKSMEFQ